MEKIFKSHSKAKRIIKPSEFLFAHLCESVKDLHILRFIKDRHQCLRLLLCCFSRINRVDAVILDHLEFFLCDLAFHHISHCCTDDRLLILPDKTDTLFRGIGALIELSRKELNRKSPVPFMHREFLFIKDVHRRFCKYASACLLKCILRNVLRIIADQDTDPCHAADAEIVTYFMPQFLGSHSKLSLLFHVYALYITHISNLLCIFFQMALH